MKHYIITSSLVLIIFAIFLYSPFRTPTDSHYSMVLSYQLLKNHTFQLDQYFKKPLDGSRYPGINKGSGMPYQVGQTDGHTYYLYPPGSSVLSVPFVALMSYAGYSPVNSDMTYNAGNELIIEGFLAS